MYHRRPGKILILLAAVVALDGCGAAPPRKTQLPPDVDDGPPVVIYVIKRKWHTDIGFNTVDLQSPLGSLRAALPTARYLLFGFGDKHYLLNPDQNFERLLGAVWPGDGLVLMTGLEDTPEQAFGANEVVRLTVSAAQVLELERFVWRTLVTRNDGATALAPGPYSGSLYYGSVERYSGLHTCNTWTAEGLRAAGLPVHTFGVEFAGQVWRQVQRIKREEAVVPPVSGARQGGDALPTSASRP
jgi:hypothetical protein